MHKYYTALTNCFRCESVDDFTAAARTVANGRDRSQKEKEQLQTAAGSYLKFLQEHALFIGSWCVSG